MTGKNQRPRLILIDDNVRSVGGHFYELMSLLATGAVRLGYEPKMATHEGFRPVAPFVGNEQDWIDSFSSRRLVRFSMGVDAVRRVPRNADGRPMGTPITSLAERISGTWLPSRKQAGWNFEAWRHGFRDALSKFYRGPQDRILVNTADDATPAVLSTLLKELRDKPLRIELLVHFALIDGQDVEQDAHLKRIGTHIRSVLRGTGGHQIQLFATTPELARQYRRARCGLEVRDVPYPTRRPPIPKANPQSVTRRPPRVLMAGLPRAEKGKAAVGQILESLQSMLSDRWIQLSMQLPAERWQSFLPERYHCVVHAALKDRLTSGDRSGSSAAESARSLDPKFGNLSTEEYHRWLDSADVGLFLYEPERYVARCSGVLLEMMARGIPVIVPDRCHLAEVVRKYGGHRVVGMIYQHREEIPSMIRQWRKHRAAMQASCVKQSQRLREDHDPRSTLMAMGIPAVEKREAA